MTIRPGELWVADIPFTDGSGSKKRPILVLWLDGSDVVAAVVTSTVPQSPTDVPLSVRFANCDMVRSNPAGLGVKISSHGTK
jgi:hypothetical protein